MLSRLVGTTLLVSAACIASLVFAKRFMVKGSGTTTRTRKMRVLDSVSLHQRCTVKLIEVEGEKLIAGFDQTGLKVLVPLNGSFDNALYQAEQNGLPEATRPDTRREVYGGPLAWTETHRKS